MTYDNGAQVDAVVTRKEIKLFLPDQPFPRQANKIFRSFQERFLFLLDHHDPESQPFRSPV